MTSLISPTATESPVKPRRRWRFHLRLRHLLVLLTLATLPPAWVVWQRRHVASQDHALHEAQMLGASVGVAPANATQWEHFRYWAGGGEPKSVSLSFQNLGKYQSWGPYGKDGAGVELYWWNEENIRRFGPELSRFDHLEQLSFWKSPLPPGMLAEILPDAPDLLHLNLHGSPVTREDMAAIERTPHLTSLVLTSSDVVDDDLRQVGQLAELQWLILEDTKVTDRGMDHLAGLTKLRRVDLSLTLVTASSLPTLIDWQVADELIVPAAWPQEAVDQLQAASPKKCVVRRSSLEFRFRSYAKALQ